MKKCWFFGDSFTRGDNCYKGDSYYELTYKEGCKRWTEIVSEYLGCSEENHAWGGNSNTHILYQLISESPNIQSGDYVFVGDTRPPRVMFFNDDGEVRNVINDKSLGYKKGDEDTILKYIVNVIVPQEKNYELYFETQYKSVLDLLEIKGVKTLFWKYTDYWFPLNKIHTITKDTNGKIKDGHYSWKAHKRKANIIINQLENPNSIL